MDTDLYRSRLCRALNSPEAGDLLDYMLVETIEENHELMREGEDAGTLYLVISGELTVYLEGPKKRVEIGQIGSDNWIGELNLVDQGPATATVIARTDCELLSLSTAHLERLRTARPDLAGLLIRDITIELADRLAQTTDRLLGILATGASPKKKVGFFTAAMNRLFGRVQ